MFHVHVYFTNIDRSEIPELNFTGGDPIPNDCGEREAIEITECPSPPRYAGQQPAELVVDCERLFAELVPKETNTRRKAAHVFVNLLSKLLPSANIYFQCDKFMMRH